MNGYVELWLNDGGFEVFGPYDAADEPQFLACARTWARRYCRAGRGGTAVKACFIHLGGHPVLAYRTRKNGRGYQVARGFRQIGACAFPNWRG